VGCPIGGPLQPYAVLHRYGDIEPQTYWGHDLDFLGSHDHMVM